MLIYLNACLNINFSPYKYNSDEKQVDLYYIAFIKLMIFMVIKKKRNF